MRFVAIRLPVLALVCGLVVVLPAQQPCATNHALHFDGVDDFVVVPHAESVKFDQAQPFTIEAWVRAPQLPPPWPAGPAPVGTIVEKWNGTCATPYPYFLRVNSPGRPLGGAYDGISCTTVSGLVYGAAGALSDGLWHHVAYTRDAQLVSSLWFDGTLAAVSVQPPLADTRNQVPVYLGRRGPGGPYSNFLDGDLDEVRISTVCRYTAPFRPVSVYAPDPATVLLLHFDEGQGYLAQDASGLANHGLLGAAVGPVAATPAWVPSTLSGPPAGLGSGVNSGPFDASFKTFWTSDVVHFGFVPGCLGTFSGAWASILVNFGSEALVTGVTPAPVFGVPPLAGFVALSAYSSPPGLCALAGDGLGLASTGWGVSLGLPPLHVGDAPVALVIPPGVFPAGSDLRMQAVYLLPDAPALLAGVTNEILLRAQP